MTATLAALVCTRPEDSVAGTRCTRWMPLSNLSRPYTPPRPATAALASLKPPAPASVVSSTCAGRKKRTDDQLGCRSLSVVI